MDVLRSLRNASTGAESPSNYDNAKTISGTSRSLTITEMLDSQIEFHKKKITDLEDAKAAISPDVERALNALAKIS